MAREHKITITNGTGTKALENGEYSVTSNIPGYDNSTLTPTSVTIVDGTLVYDFTIAATGTLTIHVTEEGTSGGVPVTGATFYRCDSTSTTVGNPLTTDEDGNLSITNVPYGTNAPDVYYKQTDSDGEHTFDDTLKQIILSQQTETVEVQNDKSTLRTINVKDANYEDIVIPTGEITLID